MVYRPISPTSTGILEDRDPLCKFPVSVIAIAILRVAVGTFCIVALVLYGVIHVAYNGFSIALCILAALTLFATLVQIFPKWPLKILKVQAFHCELGAFRCICSGDDEPEFEGREFDLGPKKIHRLNWVLDVALGLSVFIVTTIATDTWSWSIRNQRSPFLVFMFLIGYVPSLVRREEPNSMLTNNDYHLRILEIFIAVLSAFKALNSKTVYVYIGDEHSLSNRVRLPPDTASRGRQTVSIAA